jgi:hypothetical protein
VGVGKRRGGQKGGEMTQILYAHMNKIKIKKKKKIVFTKKKIEIIVKIKKKKNSPLRVLLF